MSARKTFAIFAKQVAAAIAVAQLSERRQAMIDTLVNLRADLDRSERQRLIYPPTLNVTHKRAPRYLPAAAEQHELVLTDEPEPPVAPAPAIRHPRKRK